MHIYSFSAVFNHCHLYIFSQFSTHLMFIFSSVFKKFHFYIQPVFNPFHFYIQSVLTLYSIDTHFDTTDSFWKHCGKKYIVPNQQFLIFPQSTQFSTQSDIIVSPFVHSFDITSLFPAELEEPKTGISGKGLTNFVFIFNQF